MEIEKNKMKQYSPLPYEERGVMSVKPRVLLAVME
jgi:hypothetical protein